VSVVPVWHGVVDKNGALHMQAVDLFRTWLRKFRGKPVQIVIKAAGRRKSTQQLGYLFGVVYPVIAEDLGYARG